MKKYFTFGLIMSLVGGACFAEHPMITQLLQEKQAKMKKLESCQGTTKNLKIAGISTLGITAVGVGANIAEAVVLSNTKDDVKKAKDARDEQLKIKENRKNHQEFIEMCRTIDGLLSSDEMSCFRTCFDESEYNNLLALLQQEADLSCKTTLNTITEKKTNCVDKDQHMLSLQFTQRNGQNEGEKETPKDEPFDPDDVYKYKQEKYTCTQKVKAVFDDVYDAVEKCKKQNNLNDDDILNIMYIMGTTNQYEEILIDKKIRRVYTLPNLYCDAGFSIDKDMGECEADASDGKPKTLEQKCKERHPNGTPERLACCYAGGATKWDDKTSTCSCRESNQEWKGGKCVAKPGDGNGGKGGANGGNNGSVQTPEQPAGPTERSFEITRKIKHDSVNQEINNFRYNAQIDPECQSSRTTYVGNYLWRQTCANHIYNVTIKNIDCGSGMEWNYVNNTCEQEQPKEVDVNVDTSMFNSIRTKTPAQAAGLANLAMEIAGGQRNTCGVSGTRVTCGGGKYVFNFKSTSESLPNYYNGDITTVVCRMYGGTPTYGKINKYNACDYVDKATCDKMINAVTRGVAASVGTKYTNSRCEFTWQ